MAKGRSALHIAATKGLAPAMALLLEHQPCLDLQDSNGFTPLLAAVQMDQLEVLSMLLAAGASGAPALASGWTALHLAVKTCKHEAVEALVAGPPGSVDVDATDRGGETALMMAAAAGDARSVAALVAAGADLEVKRSRKLTTALHVAAAAGHAEVVSQLLAAGADHGSKEADVQTPLHLATLAGHEAVVSVLLQGGADAWQGDRRGKGAVQLCRRAGMAELFATLAIATE